MPEEVPLSPSVPAAGPPGRIARAALAAALLLLAACGGPDSGSENRALVRLTDGNYLYTYHVLTGSEALFDTEKDPGCRRNLLRQEWRTAMLLRRRLERELDVESLSILLDPNDPTYQRLKTLGYLK